MKFEDLIGKRILVGLTYVDDDENVTDKAGFHGEIVKAGEDEGITIMVSDSGQTFVLPPDLSAVHAASPGRYQYNSDGEVVVDPDFISNWTIHEPTKGE